MKKNANQDAFMNDQVHIIVATSAFGMGVDKKDVGLVIHYDISDSLETTFKKQAGPVVTQVSAHVVMCFIVTMTWINILYC